MKFRITQPNTQLASASVQIQLDGQTLGSLGPGGSIDMELPSDEQRHYEVTACCGLFRAVCCVLGDCDLQVCWSLRTRGMELRNMI